MSALSCRNFLLYRNRILFVLFCLVMIAVGAETDDSHQNLLPAIPISSVGEELPSLSCDLGDIDFLSNDLEQLLQQDLGEDPLTAHHHLPLGASASNFIPSQCDFTSLFLEDTPRPRDLNLSFPEDNVATSLPQSERPPVSTIVPDLSNEAATKAQLTSAVVYEVAIVTHAQSLSRASSPSWSESSGSVHAGASTNIAATCGMRLASRDGSSIPRHKRPSHKRAELKRRDKIKTCLDDIKSSVPSICEKGKLSESAILSKAAEYIHQLKDGYTERGNKAAQLRREIECLSSEIHSFQENLPAAGLREDNPTSSSLDDLYQRWISERSQQSSKFVIFKSLTSRLFESFKEVVGPVTTLGSLNSRAQEWQAKTLALPVLRKQILSGMLDLTRNSGIVSDPESLKLDINMKNS